jgi:hypothetical protein
MLWLNSAVPALSHAEREFVVLPSFEQQHAKFSVSLSSAIPVSGGSVVEEFLAGRIAFDGGGFSLL